MNVALTRARRKLIVVGDSATLGTNPFYVRLLEYFDAIGAYHTIWEEIDQSVRYPILPNEAHRKEVPSEASCLGR